jgi:hypothetical protein
MKSFKQIAIEESALKKIWKGGCNGPKISVKGPYTDKNSGQTANCGAIFEYKGNQFEAMSKEFSTHPTNIISLYIDNNNLAKVEISGWLNEEDEGDYSKMVFGIANYKSYIDNRSSRYTNKVSAKYKADCELVRKAHEAIFHGNWGVQ